MDAEQELLGARGGEPIHWHFRAMPSEAQRGVIRRLALSGLAEEDIAVRTGSSVDDIRRILLEDECVRRLTPIGGDIGRLRRPWNRLAHLNVGH